MTKTPVWGEGRIGRHGRGRQFGLNLTAAQKADLVEYLKSL